MSFIEVETFFSLLQHSFEFFFFITLPGGKKPVALSCFFVINSFRNRRENLFCCAPKTVQRRGRRQLTKHIRGTKGREQSFLVHSQGSKAPFSFILTFSFVSLSVPYNRNNILICLGSLSLSHTPSHKNLTICTLSSLAKKTKSQPPRTLTISDKTKCPRPNAQTHPRSPRR